MRERIGHEGANGDISEGDAALPAQMDQGDAVIPGQRRIGDKGGGEGQHIGMGRNHRQLQANDLGDHLDMRPQIAGFQERAHNRIDRGLSPQLLIEKLDGHDDSQEAKQGPDKIQNALHACPFVQMVG